MRLNHETKADSISIGSTANVRAWLRDRLNSPRGATSTPDIFISYTHADAGRAKLFADAFEAEGFDVWWDTALRSGEAFDKVTEQALSDAKAVVVLWSKNSVESRWVRAEATEAERENKLVPAMIEACKRPIRFELTHTAELSHWRGNRSDPVWRAYVEDVRRLLGHSRSSVTPADHRSAEPSAKPLKRWILAAMGAAILLGGSGWFLLARHQSRAAGAFSGEPTPVLIHTFTAGGSADPTEAELASGLSDELIDRLRDVPGLRIGGAAAAAVANNGVFANAYVVDGNVRRDGDQLRVTTQLLSHDGEVVWSHSYDRTMSDLFAMQQDIARSIAGALSVSLDVGADSSRYGGTNNPDAYAAYLQFSAHQLDHDQSVPLRYLNRALELDPHYVKALGALSTSYGIRAALAPSRAQAEDLLEKMDASTRQEIASAPDLWIGYESRAWYYVHRRDLMAAQHSFEKAMQLNKVNDYEPMGNFAAFEAQTGRLGTASSRLASMTLINPAAKVDAVYIWIALWRGRYQEVLDRFNKLAATAQPGDLAGIGEYVAWAHLLANGEGDAIRFSRQYGLNSLAGMQEYQSDKAIESMNPAQLKDWAAKKYGDGGHSALANLALWAGYYHHPQLALELLQLSEDRLGGFATTNAWYPQMAETRRLDGFKRILEREGLVKLWRTTGDWGDFCKPTTGDDFACH